MGLDPPGLERTTSPPHRGLPTIALNNSQCNAAAIRVYEQRGFARSRAYVEGVTRKRSLSIGPTSTGSSSCSAARYLPVSAGLNASRRSSPGAKGSATGARRRALS